MDEDWRVTARFTGEPHVVQILEALRHRRLAGEVRRRLGEEIVVSSSGRHMFLYASNAEAAEEAAQVLRDVLGQHDLAADFRLERWHPLEQLWDDSPTGMRHDAAEERTIRHEHEQYQERQRSQETGLPEWMVRMELPSHHDAVALAQQMTAYGHRVIRRWKFVLAGASCEDDANVLARKIRGYAPEGAAIRTEGGAGGLRSMPFAGLSFPPPA
ncbi:MAG: hypothetical protein JO345_37160 [Streptosporangiaceae bacterium]|nr:hypothetical protein [Streptosporangiaceae bacterium]